MKTTGVIRRIDELGRIVIPKEIRKNLRIKDGENLEILVENNETISLKKYSTLNKFKELSDAIVKSSNKEILITDTNLVISYNGKENYLNKSLSNNYFKLLELRKTIKKENSSINIINDDILSSYIVEPLILNGDLIGSLVLLSKGAITREEELLADFVSKILINYIEE